MTLVLCNYPEADLPYNEINPRFTTRISMVVVFIVITLQYAVEEVLKRCEPDKVGVCVVHNKNKPKKGVLPENVSYFAAEEVEDHWLCYPWDAAEYGRSINS